MGVRAVIAQGGEGGGHTGSIATSLLVPQVVDGVAGSDVVVLGAGGFSDGRGLVAALAYGADGIAMGTRFLLTAESHVPDHIKAIYLDTPPTGTVVTTAIDGAPQRVIRTAMIDALEKSPGPDALPPGRRAMPSSFARQAGVSLPDLAKTGHADAQGPGADLGPGRARGQRADDDQGARWSTVTPRSASSRPARSSATSTRSRRWRTCSNR